jgi:polyhydroxybutyrate depolymerase
MAAAMLCGCGQGGDVHKVTVGGMEREYLLDLPDKSDRPAPLIVAFHGGYGSARGFARRTGLADAATDAGFAAVFPEGYRRSWNAGDCCGPAQRRGVDDVAFVRAILDDLDSADVDTRLVYASGFSTGGKMAYRLGCDLSGRVAALAVVSAAISIPPDTCRPHRPIPVLHIHGTEDPFAPYGGGDSTQPRTPPQRSVHATVAVWTHVNRCSGEPQPVLHRGHATCSRRRSCRGGVEVEVCRIAGLGHQWPGARAVLPSVLGPGSDDVSATALILRFFERYAAE